MKAAQISDILDREDVFKGIVACHSRKVVGVSEHLMRTHPTFAAITQTGQKFLINSVLNAVKSYVRGVIKSLSVNDLKYIRDLGGPVYCDPDEWLLGPVDVMMEDHPALHCKSNYVPSMEHYLTSYELIENPRWMAEVQVELTDHIADVSNINREYNKAASRNWKAIAQKGNR